MHRISTIALQALTVVLGIGVLAFMLIMPNFEGRNVGATLFQVYFQDPFLMYAYASSLLFFAALYQAFTLLGNIGRNKVFSPASVRALGVIKYCGFILAGLIMAGMAYIVFANSGEDDIAGGIAMGLVTTFASLLVATAAAVFESLLRRAVALKSEQELTV
jgi:Protein of unknown function (DUF2975)